MLRGSSSLLIIEAAERADFSGEYEGVLVKMQMRRVLVSTATLVVAVSLVGCGSTKKLSLKDYKAKANSICADAQKKSNKLSTPTSISDFQKYSKNYNAIQTQALGKLKGLNPPAAETKKLDALISAQGNFLSKEVQRVITNKDFATQVFNGKADLKYALQADQAAKAADLTKCESGSGA